MILGRGWLALDSLPASVWPTLVFVPGLIELTPEDVGFLAQSINETIEHWGDPEGELERLRRKLRGDDEP